MADPFNPQLGAAFDALYSQMTSKRSKTTHLSYSRMRTDEARSSDISSDYSNESRSRDSGTRKVAPTTIRAFDSSDLKGPDTSRASRPQQQLLDPRNTVQGELKTCIKGGLNKRSRAGRKPISGAQTHGKGNNPTIFVRHQLDVAKGCPLCGKALATLSTLTRHIKMVHHPCDVVLDATSAGAISRKASGKARMPKSHTGQDAPVRQARAVTVHSGKDDADDDLPGSSCLVWPQRGWRRREHNLPRWTFHGNMYNSDGAYNWLRSLSRKRGDYTSLTQRARNAVLLRKHAKYRPSRAEPRPQPVWLKRSASDQGRASAGRANRVAVSLMTKTIKSRKDKASTSIREKMKVQTFRPSTRDQRLNNLPAAICLQCRYCSMVYSRPKERASHEKVEHGRDEVGSKYSESSQRTGWAAQKRKGNNDDDYMSSSLNSEPSTSSTDGNYPGSRSRLGRTIRNSSNSRNNCSSHNSSSSSTRAAGRRKHRGMPRAHAKRNRDQPRKKAKSSRHSADAKVHPLSPRKGADLVSATLSLFQDISSSLRR